MSEHPDEPPGPPQLGVWPDPLQETVQRVEAYGRAHPDDFAGSYLEDQTLHVGFTREAERHVEAIRRELPLPDTVRPFSAVQSYVTLASLQDRVVAEREDLARSAIVVASVGIDTRANRVTIVVESATPMAEAELARRYGSANILIRGGGQYRAL